VLNLDDLAPANNYYRGYGPLEIGDGPIYGMCKDWSPDFTMFIYKPAFEQAGLDVPDDTVHLTYQEVFELARQLAVFEGDRILTWGYGYDAAWTDRMWMNMLAELDLSLYAEGFTQINLASEEAKEVVKYYFDLASENLAGNPLNPSPSWIGEDFTKGTLAICQYGFWFGAMAESDVTAGQVMMIPTATWAGVPRDCTMTATGFIMAAATKVPDAAWRVFEWYMGKEPAIDRATSGWGVPALKSMYDLVPNETEFEQQKYRVLQAELALETTPLQFNPFLGEGAVRDSWTKNLEQALLGTITFDECLANVEAEVNAAIQDGIDRLT
jgi:multiple sugar transport system substrate-binding protein